MATEAHPDLQQYVELVSLAVSCGQNAKAAREWAEEVMAREKANRRKSQ